jgi:hypothetical protein
MAAIAAARGGARTILIEKQSYLGGTGYAGMLQHICGLYLSSDTVPTETLNPGIVREIASLLRKAAPGKDILKIGRVYVLPYSRDDLQSILASLCLGEKNMEILQGETVIVVRSESGEIKDVAVEGPRGRQVIVPAVVIDCSGNGEAAAMAGAECELSLPDERQLAGYIIRVKGLQQLDETLAIKVPYHLAHAVGQGLFSPAVRYTVFSAGNSPGEGFCKMSVEGDDSAGRDALAKKEADEVIRYLATKIPEFKDAYIAGTSLKVLDREGGRVVGEYMLTQDDVLSARKFPDGVVKNAWPIELWDKSKGTTYKYVPPGDYYEIPFRCLKVRGIRNLLTAGRCISVTREALGSTRVMGTSMALGEQAGRAAAYWVKNGEYPKF